MNDVERIISELEQQREAITRAITALREVTGLGTGKGISSAASSRPSATKKKRVMTPEGRRRIAEATRKRWALRRAETATASKTSTKSTGSRRKKAAKKTTAKKAAAKKTATAGVAA